MSTTLDQEYMKAATDFLSADFEAARAILHASIPITRPTMDVARDWHSLMSQAHKAIANAGDSRRRSQVAHEHIEAMAACGERLRRATRVELGFEDDEAPTLTSKAEGESSMASQIATP